MTGNCWCVRGVFPCQGKQVTFFPLPFSWHICCSQYIETKIKTKDKEENEFSSREVAMYQTILVPVDGSKRAEAILSHVEHLVKGGNGQAVFLKVQEEGILLGVDEVIDMEKYQKEYGERIERSKAYLDSLKVRFHEKGINAATRMERGSVVKTILNVAHETSADLIALATHGFGGGARVSYGSVAAGILQAAEIPILLIRSCS
jgi:nucleotide-binding universal stress UspA family protein